MHWRVRKHKDNAQEADGEDVLLGHKLKAAQSENFLPFWRPLQDISTAALTVKPCFCLFGAFF